MIAVGTGGAVAVVAVSRGRPPADVSLAATYAAMLLALAWIDLRQRVVPNRIVLPAIMLALVGAAVGVGPGLAEALLGGLLAAGPFALLFVLPPPGAVGAGDVKMAGFVGMIAGVPGVFGPLLIATVSGGAAAGLLGMRRGVRRSHLIPYGPFLAFGGLVGLL